MRFRASWRDSGAASSAGVQLVACSTAANAKALLKSAIRSDNPIVFFEHVLLYNVKGVTYEDYCQVQSQGHRLLEPPELRRLIETMCVRCSRWSGPRW